MCIQQVVYEQKGINLGEFNYYSYLFDKIEDKYVVDRFFFLRDN